MSCSPAFNGVEVLTQLRRKLRGLRVVFFSGCLQEQLIARAVALGADAYVLKSQPLHKLLEAVDSVNAGGKSFDPAVVPPNGRMSHLMSWQTLTIREQEVARLIAEGKTTKEAAAILGVSAKDARQAPHQHDEQTRRPRRCLGDAVRPRHGTDLAGLSTGAGTVERVQDRRTDSSFGLRVAGTSQEQRLPGNPGH